MRLAFASLFACALLGCPDKSSQPAGDDRLLAKLKAEKDREQKEGPMIAPKAPMEPISDEKVNPLAEFAAKGTQKRELPLPSKTLLALGKASLRLNGVTAMHTVGESPAITTDDWFVRVSFSATASEPTDVDLSGAHLELNGRSFSFARDAQAAYRHQAHVTATSEGDNLVVFFEATTDALAKGLTLVVPQTPSDARLELQ